MSKQEHPIDVLGTEHLQADLKGRSVRGGFTTITSQGAQFVIASVSTIVLARLLTPADFGLVAMVVAPSRGLDKLLGTLASPKQQFKASGLPKIKSAPFFGSM